MDTSLSVQSSTFFEQIKSCEGLDLRDNRGKRHCIGFVLLSLSISLECVTKSGQLVKKVKGMAFRYAS